MAADHASTPSADGDPGDAMLKAAISALGASQGPGAVDSLLQSCGELIGADHVFVARYDAAMRCVDVLASWSCDGTSVIAVPSPEAQPYGTLLDGTPCFCPNGASARWPDATQPVDVGYEALAGQPLIARGGAVVGMLVAIGRDPFPAVAVPIVAAFAVRVAADLDAEAAAEQIGEAALALEAAQAAGVASEARLRDFATASSDWFWEQDAALRFIFVSSGLRAMTGVDPAGLIGRTRASLLADGLIRVDAEHWEALSELVATGQRFRDIEYSMRDRGGVWRRLQISGVPLHDGVGQFTGYRGIGRDVTGLHEVQEQARRTEERLRDGIEVMPAGFALFDADDRLILINGNFEQRLVEAGVGDLEPGTSFETLLRRLCAVGAVGPVAAGAAREAFIARRMESHRNPTGLPMELALPDGTHIAVRERRTAEGGTVLIRSDITELKRSQQRLMDAIEAIPVGFIMLDADDRLVQLNRRYRDFYPEHAALLDTGITHAEALSARLVPHEGDSDYAARAARLRWRLAHHRRSDGVALHLFTPAGRDVMMSEIRTADGGTVGVHTDITQLVMLQHQLADARRAAEDALAIRTRFLANISHELRTPLNAVIGFAELMLMETQGPLAAPYRNYVETIKKSGEFLLSLIVDILDTARVEAGKMSVDRAPVDVARLADEVVAMLTVQAQRRGLTLTLRREPALPLVQGDDRRLKQVMQNLVSNAVKFTEKGGVTIALSSSESAYRIEVVDTGQGMTAEDIAFAMEPFQQRREGGAHTMTDGTGLGLPLVKAIVELHGGRFVLDSTPGQGTVARVTLPLT